MKLNLLIYDKKEVYRVKVEFTGGDGRRGIPPTGAARVLGGGVFFSEMA